MKTKTLLTFLFMLDYYCMDAQIQLDNQGNVGIGTTTPENYDGWNRVLNVYGLNHSKITTSSSNVNTGLWSHNTGCYGAPAGGIVGTYTNHPFTIITNKTAKVIIQPGGNVGIASSNPQSLLSIGTDGGTSVSLYSKKSISGTAVGIIGAGESTGANLTIGVLGYGTNLGTSAQCYGLYGNANYSAGPISSGRSYGVIGIAGNLAPGYNFGVYGLLQGSNNGAAIIGVSPDFSWSPPNDDKYAGYFVGNVKVASGILYTPTGTVSVSDGRLKKSISVVNNSDNIFLLQPIKYNLKSIKEQNQLNISLSGNKSTTDTLKFLDLPDPDYIKKPHYGFLADSVQKIYPELVYQNENGVLGIEYQGFIPIIIDQMKKMRHSLDENSSLSGSVKELKNQIDSLSYENIAIKKKLTELENRIYKCCGSSKTKGAEIMSEKEDKFDPINEAWLGQNAPNPFSSATTVQFCTPQDLNYKNAAIFVYDLKGLQKKVYKITTKGQSSIIINGYDLAAGIYFYSLIIDNKLIDTKQMILTEQ